MAGLRRRQLRGQEGNPVLDAFTSGFMVRPTGGADFYRPMVILSLAFDDALWGDNSVGYHVTNLVLHAASIGMVALFAWLLLRSRAAAIGAAFLFAVHPVHAESVCGPCARIYRCKNVRARECGAAD